MMWRGKGTRIMNRVNARLAARARPPKGLVSQPEPRSIGLFARGRQLSAGNFLFAGQLIEAPEASIWDIAPDQSETARHIQGCAWLDDLAAVGDHKARTKAQDWVYGWIDRYGGGKGPGWTPDLTGRRLIRWINHAFFLMRGRERVDTERFLISLARQSVFLSRRWKSARPGLARFEALSGMVYAGLSLEGMQQHVDAALSALTKDCQTQINAEGGVPTRNPEELLEVLTLLSWVAKALAEAGRDVPVPIRAAIDRIAPTLRALRHADGGLARFHGGGRGIDGRLDYALVESGNKEQPNNLRHMGYARLAAGRTTLIADAAAPPSGKASYEAHASTCAIEVTSGRRPMIVSAGAGGDFGPEWKSYGRATASHSTLSIEGYSSSRLGSSSRIHGEEELLLDVPDYVLAQQSTVNNATRLEMAHNGYLSTHGLTHARTLDLSLDGRTISGEDVLTTLSRADEKRFDQVRLREPEGIPYSVRFHLHPDVVASLDLGGTAVSLTLKSGEIWVMRHDGSAEMGLETSVYLEKGRLKPRSTQQVVLSSRAMSYATRVRWTLAKAHETPNAVRDFGTDDPTITD